jgi:hypothetical protein
MCVEQMRYKRNKCKVLAGNPEAKRARSWYTDKLILKLIVKNRICGRGLDLFGLEKR